MTKLATRRQFLQAGAATTAITCLVRFAGGEESPQRSVNEVRESTLRFIESMRLADGAYGRYRYAAGCHAPTLYSSTYAAMTRHLYRDLDSLTESQRAEWIEYLQSHQDDDGLFRDPVIFDQGWYQGDPEWCGRRHLSCHVVTALTCLGAVARKPLRFLDPVVWPAGPPAGSGEWSAGSPAVSQPSGSEPSSERAAGGPSGHSQATGLIKWLEARDWERQPDFVGNEVLNVGTLLQYACGGFGQGVHTGSDRESSACEDIDSIDPLVRLMQVTDYRRADIRTALQRGLKQVLLNQMPDGGWWFVRGKGFAYGHEQLAAGATEGAMFPTWFRTLTLAYLAKALPDSVVGRYDWQFCDCPGLQFWNA